MTASKTGAPRASLSVLDGAMMMVGIIIGIGIFKIPQVVALNVGSEAAFIGAWVLGGVMTLIGALVYAELAAAYPSTGGEYHFLTRAFGQPVGFLFAWARTTVIQTGAIAAVAFVLGDFAQQLYSLGTFGSSIYAAAALILLTLVNLAGTYQSKTTQNVFTVLEAVSLAAIALVGFLYGGGVAPAPTVSSDTALGLAMVFVLFTFGGWNEAAYLSADMRNVKRDMIRILLIGTVVVTVLYVLINLAYLHVLGLDGIRKSDAVAAAVMRVGFGASGAVILSLIVCCAALSTMNASIFTGARLYHALGEDLSLRRLRLWSVKGNNPRNAIIAQSLIALALVIFGAVTPRRLPGDGRIHRAGILVFPVAGRRFVLRAAASRPKTRAPVPRPALSDHPALVLRHLRLSSVFEPRLYRHRRVDRHRGAAGGHSAAWLCAQETLRCTGGIATP